MFLSNTPDAQEPAINNQPAAVRRYALFGGATAAGQLGTLLGASKSVRLFITGDLAFYATIQGKEHMSGTWCPYCDLQHTSWQLLGHSAGKKWTIEALEAHLHKLQAGTLDKKKPKEVMGVTATMIFDAVPLENWIVPVLHLSIGVGNGLLKQFLDWLDIRIERLPIGLSDLRAETVELQVDLEDYIDEDYEEWMHSGGQELANLVMERLAVTDMAAAKHEGGEFVLGPEERKEARKYAKALKKGMEKLEAAKQVQTNHIALQKKLIAESKKKAKKEEKELGGNRIKGTRRDVESILRNHGIDRGAHHGGELVGGGCRVLMEKADAIFLEISTMMLAIPGTQRHASDSEIVQRSESTVEALKQFDALFAMLRIPNGQTADCSLQDILLHAKKAIASWRQLAMSVTPKVHIIEDHAIEQFERLQGFGDFTEDYIEQAHQWGEIEERRTHGLRDRTKAANAHSKWEFMRLNPLVVKEVTIVAEGAKRKFRRDANGRTRCWRN
jgi:hypothetical protein